MFEERNPRRVVPRWRSSKVTAKTAEAKTEPPGTVNDFTAELSARIMEFDSDSTVPVAAELMFLAREAGDIDSARRGAELILRRAADITSSQLVRSAKRVLDCAEEHVTSTSSDFVREARKLLLIDFRNPILLMDVARELTTRRQDAAAVRYVRAAVAMAPMSRFVVRSAARFYLHRGEYDVAHDILRRTPLLISDRWVQASEIAVATVRGKTSELIKKASRSLSQMGVNQSGMSELSSAIATVELLSGADKNAKRLFQKALTQPNDNSLAQIEWAATKLKLVVDEHVLLTPFSYEANSHNAYRRLQMEDAIYYAKQWVEDEPFASRPLDALCFLLCLEGQYDRARRVAEDAVLAEGGTSFPLALNLLFTKIQSGDVDDALEELVRLGKHPEAISHGAHILANAGALAYATGEPTLGKEFYLRAINAARRRNEPHTEALARAFFARAAVSAHDPSAEAILTESTATVQRLPNPGAIYVMSLLVDTSRKQQLETTGRARVAKRRWTWDAASNTLSSFH